MKILKQSIFSKAGFSLMELVITVTIIIILSAISGPIYKSFSSKAHLAEAYALLGTIRSAQEAYFNDRNYYLYQGCSSSGAWNVPTCNEEVLGIDARTNKYYTCFYVGYSDGYTHGILQGAGYYNRGFYAIALGKQSVTMLYNRTLGVIIK